MDDDCAAKISGGIDTVFPKELDGATVLFYTPKGNYGAMKYPNGEIAEHYRYLAVCKYMNSAEYYLFCCNEKYEVVSDSVWGSIDECMGVAASSYKNNIVWYRAE